MTIINNSLVADESKLRIHNPILYVPDPTKGKPVSGAKWYFGIVGRDPLLPENQKIVYALQEDNSAVPLSQPVIGGAGGVPEYNNSTVSLAVSGSYSLKILDSKNAQIYYFPRVDAINNQGFSGVIAEESQTVSGSLTLTFAKIEATTAGFYISKDSLGAEFKGSYLQKDIDYVSNNPNQITLLTSVPDGTVVIGREMDPTGQIVPVTDGSSALFVFQDIASAKISDLQIGDTITINGGIIAGDKLGGNKYLTVAGGTGTADDENFIDLTNGNQLQAIENNYRLSRYVETTTDALSVSSVVTLDLNNGNVFNHLLTENTSLSFTNINQGLKLTSTVSLKITQDASTAYTVTFPVNIKWAGGVAPVITAANNAVDRYVFITDDGGTTWHGAITGQDFS